MDSEAKCKQTGVRKQNAAFEHGFWKEMQRNLRSQANTTCDNGF